MFPKSKYQEESERMVRPEARALAERGNVTLVEWKAFRGNSWEFELIVPKLDDEAFLDYAKNGIANCQFDKRRPWRSYNESVMGGIAPELVRRLEAALVRDRRSGAR
jgi:hypothetical protein